MEDIYIKNTYKWEVDIVLILHYTETNKQTNCPPELIGHKMKAAVGGVHTRLYIVVVVVYKILSLNFKLNK